MHRSIPFKQKAPSQNHTYLSEVNLQLKFGRPLCLLDQLLILVLELHVLVNLGASEKLSCHLPLFSF